MPASPGEALRIPTAVTSLRTRVRMSAGARGTGETDEDDALPGSTRSSGRAREGRPIGRVDHGVERVVRKALGRPDALEAQGPGVLE